MKKIFSIFFTTVFLISCGRVEPTTQAQTTEPVVSGVAETAMHSVETAFAQQKAVIQNPYDWGMINTKLTVGRGNNLLNINAKEENWEVKVTFISSTAFQIATPLENMGHGLSSCSDGTSGIGKVNPYNGRDESCKTGVYIFTQTWTDEIYAAGGTTYLEGSAPIALMVEGTPDEIIISLGYGMFENPNWFDLWENCQIRMFTEALEWEGGSTPGYFDIELIGNACPENKK